MPEIQELLDNAGLELVESAQGLTLVGAGMELRADFSRSIERTRQHNVGRELLVKAARIKGLDPDVTPRAVDATAGFGEDALLLAAAGFRVTMIEANPVIAALTRDALARAASIPELESIVARMELREGDSIALLPALGFEPDVVYLDPMFPAKRKSAATKKKFQLIHMLEAPCANAEELLGAALAAHPLKVVIKRPLKGPFLADVKPAYSLSGKEIRYDCVLGRA